MELPAIVAHHLARRPIEGATLSQQLLLSDSSEPPLLFKHPSCYMRSNIFVSKFGVDKIPPNLSENEKV